MRVVLSVVVLASFSCTAPAFASDKKTDQPADKKICRREVPTGSLMGKVTCHTKAEWDALAARGQLDINRTREMERSRGMVNSTRAGMR